MAAGNVPLSENNHKYITRKTKYRRFPKSMPVPLLPNPGLTIHNIPTNKTRPTTESLVKPPKSGHSDRKLW